MSERRQLIDLAYRLLGSLAEAEDAVQETYTRWYAMPRSSGGDRITGRLADDGRQPDLLRRARLGPRPAGALRRRMAARAAPAAAAAVRRGYADPADRVTLDESVSMAFLVVLETMTPAERVAFVLHDVFRYSFADVAEIVGRTPAACRQLASSARHRVARRGPGCPGRAARQRAGNAVIIRDFKAAWEAKDIGALIGLLDLTEPPSPTAAARSAPHCAQSKAAIRSPATWPASSAAPRLTITERAVNGQPGLVAEQDGVIVTVFAFDIAAGQIARIWMIRNPASS